MGVVLQLRNKILTPKPKQIILRQNTSHAVMAQRRESKDSLDDFPTPPWATRALMTYVLNTKLTKNQHCWEPACGRGYMAAPLQNYFKTVQASDIGNYGYGKVVDFLNYKPKKKFDWVITNPPFKLAEEFFHHAWELNVNVALLVRTVFIEGIGRYTRLFSQFPPTYMAQFVERVPIVKGRIDRKASTATGYAWIIWEKVLPQRPGLIWIPPCRKKLELDTDYTIDPRKGIGYIA